MIDLANKHRPDILSCLADLSNDEVFTEPPIANRVLDMLPQELWSDPGATFLDPATKSGIFLREIVKRLDHGLEGVIEDRQERINHICTQQVFGIAITELTALTSRRSTYCSKTANGKYSICSAFTDASGRILFPPTEHMWNDDGKCTFCGVSRVQYERGEGKEQHAYEFIHTDAPERIFNMKFDVVVANPPYQLSDEGHGVSAEPIFQLFVEQAKKLNPRYLSMIIPARWYAGGKGLKDFRMAMLQDRRIRKLVDFESSKDCFSGVDIAGGICYFLWDRDHEGPCEVTNYSQDVQNVATRLLDEFPVLIRSNMAVAIVHKILQQKDFVPYNSIALPRNPFNFATNYEGRKRKRPGDVELLTSSGFQYVARSNVTKNQGVIDKYKVLIGRLVPSNGELDVRPGDGYKVITDTRILGPGQINTETYLDIGVFETEEEALHFDTFLKSKLPRFLLRQAISSLNVSRECFRFVPALDFRKEWTDAKLYAKYGLTEGEIALVESTIRAFPAPAEAAAKKSPKVAKAKKVVGEGPVS